MKIPTVLPAHIAFIMDGNRRWAKRRGLSKFYGHKKGADTLVDLIKFLSEIKGIKYASFFAFSTENWNREEKEIEAIFNIVEEMLGVYEKDFLNLNIKFVAMGDISRFPENLREKIIKIVENSKKNSDLGVTLP